MTLSISGFFGDLAKAGIKVEDFLTSLVTGAKKLQAIYAALSGPTLAAVTAVFTDVVKAVASGEAAATAGSSGNVIAAITLSENTVTLIKTVVTDAKMGIATIKNDFEALGITL